MTDAGRDRAVEPEIATTTLAEIYVQQGLFDRALSIYRRVAERTPEDARIATRIVELEREIERLHAVDATPGAAAVPVPPPVPVPPAEAAPDAAPAEPTGRTPVRESAPRPPEADHDVSFQAWLDGK